MYSYISLFSSAGVGCFGLSELGFECVATAELIERRLSVQRINNKCWSDDGYICGDLTKQETKNQLYHVVTEFKTKRRQNDVDLIIATPPCQGMSVANHKKKGEIVRNSLVVESIRIIEELKPRYFIFENVRAFLKALCVDTDGTSKSIDEAIHDNLGADYYVESRVLNFKNYGANSSRTRTLVIGVRKDLKEITPCMLFPTFQKEKTLRQVIGDLPRLTKMGEYYSQDFYHSFRPYKVHMLPWIKATPYGKSAFDNDADHLKPHQLIDGQIVLNKSKNSDKYKRQLWEKVGPCIHTRNDCLPSQNTIHPEDNRVFSIRELMRMMSVPNNFKWIPENEVPTSEEEFLQFFKKHDVNIRQCLGEAVPTAVITNIGMNICEVEKQSQSLSEKEILTLIDAHRLTDTKNLKKYITENKNTFTRATIFKICELANSNRQNNAAFYTRQDICYATLANLPAFEQKDTLTILEPSVGIGNFLYALSERYPKHELQIDCVDIDEESLSLCQFLADLYLPPRVKIRLINIDFLNTKNELRESYDLVIGNPPYKKILNSQLRDRYRTQIDCNSTSNLYVFFLLKALKLSLNVSLIIPKSFLNSPEYKMIREELIKIKIIAIHDFGESAFSVKIETIALTLKNTPPKNEHKIAIYSYRLKKFLRQDQSYVTKSRFGAWLLYRNQRFDDVCESLQFGCFSVFRDRQLTKKNTKSHGRYQVIRARNIGANGRLINITGYNRYVDDITHLAVGKYINKEVILVPNLTYNPRAMRLPTGCIADGSAAILIPKIKVSDDDIEYFSSKEFREFYQIARNYGTRSMNIDSVSVNYFGIKKKLDRESITRYSCIQECTV